mgnify:CR=1 FL=1
MATPLRKQSPSVEQQLFEKPYEFEFAQAVKLLEGLYGDKKRLGETAQSSFESVRLKSNILLSTPPSDLYSLTLPASEKDPVTLVINFMGIAGQTGPLPNVYSELILDRLKEKDYAFREFLDVFNHRLSSIHYRIHVKYTIALNPNLPGETEVAEVLKYLGGMTRAAEDNAHLLPLRSYLKYVGLLWQKPHSAVGLEVALKDYFQLPVSVEQFAGRWFQIEQEERTFLGEKGRHGVLGQGAALGTKVWIQGEKIRLRVGPLDLVDYCRMLLGAKYNKLFSEFSRHYLGRENLFDYRISLKKDQATLTRLDGKSALGWTSWMIKTAKGYTPESIVVRANDPLKI